MLDNEARLKEALIQCDKERVVWERRCLQLEQDKTDMNQLIGLVLKCLLVISYLLVSESTSENVSSSQIDSSLWLHFT